MKKRKLFILWTNCEKLVKSMDTRNELEKNKMGMKKVWKKC
ncbi:MAG: hypothetical protein RR486_08400 [Clostridium sp.]